MISKGTHKAVCRSLQFGFTSKGGEQVAVEFEIVGEDDEEAGHSITWFGFFTEKTMARTIESLRYLGWAGDDLSELPALAEAGQLAQEVEIVVDHEKYEGKWSTKVRWVNRPGGGRVQLERPMEGSDLKTFAARMKGAVMSAGRGRSPAGNGSRAAAPPARGGGGAARPAPHPNEPGGINDDLPFATADIGAEPDPRARWSRCL